MSLDTKVGIRFYPEATNYFWRVDVFLHDYDNKKAFIMKLEAVIIPFVRKDNTNARNRARISSTTRKTE